MGNPALRGTQDTAKSGTRCLGSKGTGRKLAAWLGQWPWQGHHHSPAHLRSASTPTALETPVPQALKFWQCSTGKLESLCDSMQWVEDRAPLFTHL